LAYSTARQGLGPLAPEARVSEAPGEELMIEADQAQLIQALVVLFENALLALGEVSGDKEIRVSLERASEERVRIRVEDSGPGIPAELSGRLFQPFVTGRKRGAARPGTGLGLATAKRIIERHQGSISADRSPLGGAAFLLELPVHPAIERPAQAEGGAS
jgi:signal transduction histidine kinase